MLGYEKGDATQKESGICKSTNKIFVDNIPLDLIKDLPSSQRSLCALLAYSIVFVLFVVSLYQGIEQSKRSFISLTPDSGICRPVPKLLSGSYLMDSEGNWEGSRSFVTENATYEVVFDRFLNTGSRFEIFIDDISKEIQRWSEVMKLAVMTDQLLFWTSWQYEIEIGGYVQKFRFTGYPRQIFKAEVYHGGVASISGTCEVPNTPFFDAATGQLRISWEYNMFLTGRNCYNSLMPDIFTFPTLVRAPEGQKFSIDFDIEGVITSIAVNMAILPIGNLINANSEFDVHFMYTDGRNYILKNKFYTRYPSMNPIRCVIPADSSGNPISGHATDNHALPITCFVKVNGNQLLLPLLSNLFPGCATCPADASPLPFNVPASVCNELHTSVSFIHFPPHQVADRVAASNESTTELLKLIDHVYNNRMDRAVFWYIYLMRYSFGTTW